MKNFLIILGLILICNFIKMIITEGSNTPIQPTTTNANQSRYNDMNPADYYKEMKSNNLQYSDIAWHAKN